MRIVLVVLEMRRFDARDIGGMDIVIDRCDLGSGLQRPAFRRRALEQEPAAWLNQIEMGLPGFTDRQLLIQFNTIRPGTPQLLGGTSPGRTSVRRLA